MIFKDEDAGLADNCLAHAKDLYDFAINYKAKYSDSSPQGLFLKLIAFFSKSTFRRFGPTSSDSKTFEVGNFYNSWSGYQDEAGFRNDVAL